MQNKLERVCYSINIMLFFSSSLTSRQNNLEHLSKASFLATFACNSRTYQSGVPDVLSPWLKRHPSDERSSLFWPTKYKALCHWRAEGVYTALWCKGLISLGFKLGIEWHNISFSKIIMVQHTLNSSILANSEQFWKGKQIKKLFFLFFINCYWKDP
jgi:hypothetical protein